MTEKMAYESLEMVMSGRFLDEAERARRIAGSKTVSAQNLWQTMEHSMGVTLTLRKTCWWSAVRPLLAAGVVLSEHVWGRRTRRMGWRNVV